MIFFDDIHFDFNQTIKFDGLNFGELFSLFDVNIGKPLEFSEVIFKYYGYQEIIGKIRKKNFDLFDEKELDFFKDYHNYINEISQKILIFIIIASIVESRHSKYFTKHSLDDKYYYEIDKLNMDDIEFNQTQLNTLNFLTQKKSENYKNFITFLFKFSLFFRKNFYFNRDIEGNYKKTIHYYFYHKKLFDSKYLKNINCIELLEYLSQFIVTNFKSGFGGKKWQNIVQHSLDYLSGDINTELFIDKSFSLQHNSGFIFNKNFIFNTSDEMFNYRVYIYKNSIDLGYDLNFGLEDLLLSLQSSSSVLNFSHFVNYKYKNIDDNLLENFLENISLKVKKYNFFNFFNKYLIDLDIENTPLSLYFLIEQLTKSFRFDRINFLKNNSKEFLLKDNLIEYLSSNKKYNCKLIEYSNKKYDLFDVGNKALSLFTLKNNQINVPDFLLFNIDTSLKFLSNPYSFNDFFNLKYKKVIKLLGTNDDPYMISVRSGSAISMPGMMNTILNVGIDDTTYLSLCKKYSEEIINECLINFYYSFSENILNLKIDKNLPKEKVLTQFKKNLSKNNIHYNKKLKIPLTIREQIFFSTRNVFESWNSLQAIQYRKAKSISNNLGTSCIFQQMILGNLNNNSFTAVIFSSKGVIEGEYLQKSQGDLLVNGKVTPQNLNKLESNLYNKIYQISQKITNLYNFPQDIEITVENNNIYVLQSRKLNIKDNIFENIIYPNIKNIDIFASGLAANNGIISGIIVKNEDDIEKYKNSNKKLILYTKEALPEHTPLLLKTDAFLTEEGGFTSHAAIIARSLNKPCIVSVNKKLESGQLITLDGKSGFIWNYEIIIKNNHYLINKTLNTLNIDKNSTLNEIILKSWLSTLNKNNKKKQNVYSQNIKKIIISDRKKRKVDK